MTTDADLLEAALIGLQQKRDDLDAKIAELRSRLGGRSTTDTAAPVAGTGARKRVLSAAARERIAAAQRKRWAKARAAKQPQRAKRRISAAGRKRIIEATKKRWAEFRAQKAAAGQAKKPARKTAAAKKPQKAAE